MTDIVRDPYGNPLKRDATITALRAEVEKLRADIAYADKHAEKVESLLWGTAKEREKLRAALELFACDCIESGNLCPSPQNCRNYIARAALEGK